MHHRRLFPLEISLLLVVFVSWASAQTGEPPWRPVGSVVAANPTPAASWNTNKTAENQTWSPYYNPSPLFQPGGLMYRGPMPVYPVQSSPAGTAVFTPAQVPVSPTPSVAPTPAQPTPQFAVQQQIAVSQTPVQQPVVQTPVQQPQPQMVPTPQPQPQIVQTPPAQQPVVQTPAAQPPAANPSPPATVQAEPSPPATVQANPAAAAPMPQPAAQPVVQAPPNAPYEDGRVNVKGNHSWAEISIAAYTSRFHPTDNPEQAVREWIERLTADADWNGPEWADLAVSSQVVKVYHEPRVHEQVAQLCGRFVNYVPGKLNCRVQLINVESSKWLSRYRGQLQTVSSGNGRHVWLMNSVAAEQFADEMKRGSGALVLTSQAFAVANGQNARVSWVADGQQTAGVDSTVSMRPDYSAAAELPDDAAVDGVDLVFSPLVAGEDGVSFDVAALLTTRSSVKKWDLFKPVKSILGAGKNPLPSNVRSAEMQSLVRVPPGKHLLIGLDGVPTLKPRKWRAAPNREATILALISVSDAGNSIVGGTTDVNTAQTTPASATTTAAKPSTEQSELAIASRPQFEFLSRR